MATPLSVPTSLPMPPPSLTPAEATHDTVAMPTTPEQHQHVDEVDYFDQLQSPDLDVYSTPSQAPPPRLG